MQAEQILRYVALGFLLAGLFGLAMSYTDVSFGSMASDAFFFVGVGFLGIGVVVLADLGRRAREAATQSDTDTQ
jgi:hypothetical protein